MCSRIWVEKIVFLKFFGTVSKENKFLLVTIATVVKENFPRFISKYFLCWCYFCEQNFLTGLEHDIFFLEDFLLFAFPWQQGPKFGLIPTFFCGSVNFSFISIYLQIFKGVLFYLPKIYCFKEKGVIMKSSYVIHLKVGTNFFEHIFNICPRFENIRRTYIRTGLKNIRKLVRLKINLKTNKQLEWKEQPLWFTTVNLFIFTFGMFLHNAQPVFTCSKSALKTSKQCVKYVQS